jgi:hypothetical protein
MCIGKVAFPLNSRMQHRHDCVNVFKLPQLGKEKNETANSECRQWEGVLLHECVCVFAMLPLLFRSRVDEI